MPEGVAKSFAFRGGYAGVRMSWLFSLNEYENSAQENAHESVGALARSRSSLLSLIPTEPAESIPVSRMSDESGRYLEIDPVQISSPIHVPFEQVFSGSLSDVFVAFDDAAGVQEEAMGRAVISTLSDVTEFTGNQIDANGRPLSWDLIIETLDQMEISFDEDDKMDIQIVVSPEGAAQLRSLGPPSLEQVARREAVLARKLEQWKSSRRQRRSE